MLVGKERYILKTTAVLVPLKIEKYHPLASMNRQWHGFSENNAS